MSSASVTLLGKLFQIQGPIDQKEELCDSAVLNLETGNFLLDDKCSCLPSKVTARSVRYFGAVPLTHLYIMASIL